MSEACETKQETTAEHFCFFKAACQKWIDLFGLTEWDFDFVHVRLDGQYGSATYSGSTAVVTVRFSTLWDDAPLNDTAVEQTARHEMIHILLARLRWLADERYASEKEIAAEDEHLVRRIEHALDAVAGTALAPSAQP